MSPEQIRQGTNNPRFSQIPDWLIDEATPRALQCYAVLASYANWGTGQAFPGRKAVGQRMRCSLPTVDTAIAELQKLGAVNVESGRDEGKPNTYWIFFFKNDRPIQEGGVKPAWQGVESQLGTGCKADLAQTITIEQEPRTIATAKPQRATRKAPPPRCSEGETQRLKAQFPHLDVDHEVAQARNHPAIDGKKDEYLYLLNWLKKAEEFRLQRSQQALRDVAGPRREVVSSSAARHNGFSMKDPLNVSGMGHRVAR